jgi:hypothetical protein
MFACGEGMCDLATELCVEYFGDSSCVRRCSELRGTPWTVGTGNFRAVASERTERLTCAMHSRTGSVRPMSRTRGYARAPALRPAWSARRSPCRARSTRVVTSDSDPTAPRSRSSSGARVCSTSRTYSSSARPNSVVALFDTGELLSVDATYQSLQLVIAESHEHRVGRGDLGEEPPELLVVPPAELAEPKWDTTRSILFPPPARAPSPPPHCRCRSVKRDADRMRR